MRFRPTQYTCTFKEGNVFALLLIFIFAKSSPILVRESKNTSEFGGEGQVKVGRFTSF